MTERAVPGYFAAFIADYFGMRGVAWVARAEVLATLL